MKIGNAEKQIGRAALAWMASGLFSMLVGAYIEANTVCSCPVIPANATPSEIASICPCPSNGAAFLIVGGIVILFGLAILVMKKRLAAYV